MTRYDRLLLVLLYAFLFLGLLMASVALWTMFIRLVS